MNEVSMNKVKDEMRDEYRREELGKGVRGKYRERVSKLANLLLLEDNVVKSFSAGEAAPLRPPSRFILTGIWVTAIASFSGMVAMILLALDKIQTGHGLDTFRSYWLVEDSWIGFILSVIVLTIVGLTAGFIGWSQRRKERREIQQLDIKYGLNPRGTPRGTNTDNP